MAVVVKILFGCNKKISGLNVKRPQWKLQPSDETYSKFVP